jgi:FHS family L-fucose permease-like MFS transporter
MIGRWTGAISVFNLSPSAKKIAMIIVPFIAFGVVLGANSLHGSDVRSSALCSMYCRCHCCIFLWQEKPVKTLLTLSILAALAMVIGSFTTGLVSVFAFISGGLCCSIMWPAIFSLVWRIG